ncbi:TolC family protein [Variovorax terrae]|uniref:TolC family protein n=1 Tax=Variovorax terrae TaxID=2923278 RepID=A0A9X1VWP9_9BURK|nr:TolC family protein [Variovorax terrae]MCJ0765161.1 TolC family protein [Variovorax terrae]
MNTLFVMRRAVAAVVAWHAAQAWAQAGLPDEAAVRQALENHPAIASADAERASQSAHADALQRGPHEFVLRATPQRRIVRNPQERFTEGQLMIERPLRLGGKAAADAALAEATRAQAGVALEDARHELARELLQQWFAALRLRIEWQAQLRAQSQAQALAAAVEARVKQGDAAALDLALARADLERARAAGLAAAAAARAGEAALQGQFPGLRLPPPDAAPGEAQRLGELLPREAPGSPQDLGPRYVQASHELRLARADYERLQQQAVRTGLERRPDPTVGAFMSLERAGAERVIGVSLSIPLGGGYRDAQAAAAEADARAAQARHQRVERKVQAEFESLWATLQGGLESARALQEASRQQQAALARMTRAYALGEAGVAELLAAQRAGDDTRRQADVATVEALHAYHRLQLDLHRLWDFD